MSNETQTHYLLKWEGWGQVVFPTLEWAEEEKSLIIESESNPEEVEGNITIEPIELTAEEVANMKEFGGW